MKYETITVERGSTHDTEFEGWVNKVYRAWVSEYLALPDLDANANAVAIQRVGCEHESWERDYEVPSRCWWR